MKIVVLDGFTLNPGDLSWKGFEEIGDLTVYDRTPDGLILERARGAQIILTNKTPLRKETIEKLTELQYIGVLATGYDVVDVEAAKNNDIVVTNVPEYGSTSVAQMAFALLMELCHHVQRHSDAVKNGAWSQSDDFCFWNYPLIELVGKTMGIIGLGRIGKQVAQIAVVFGMKVVAYDKYPDKGIDIDNFAWAELDELLRVSDVVSLHCPLFPDTEGIINHDSLKKMKETAFLINNSRGPLIVEEDLVLALNNGEIAGAALDVLAEEPPGEDNPLLAAENCIITPHISWATRESRTRLMETAVNNLGAYLEGQPQNVIN
ncbi:MAG: D-2-hydroxyacid dehydrogenase [Halanaerobiales bacterium]